MIALPKPKPTMDLDEMGEASFPASDPPAVWTWDVEPPSAPGPEPGALAAAAGIAVSHAHHDATRG